jgi:hypothetical protein
MGTNVAFNCASYRLSSRRTDEDNLMDSPLIQDDYSDFVLKEDARSVWITVDNISVYVRRTDEGVAVDLYPLSMEMEDSIVGTWCLRQEAKERLEDYEHQLEADNNRQRATADWKDLRPESDGDEEGA